MFLHGGGSEERPGRRRIDGESKRRSEIGMRMCKIN